MREAEDAHAATVVFTFGSFGGESSGYTCLVAVGDLEKLEPCPPSPLHGRGLPTSSSLATTPADKTAAERTLAAFDSAHRAAARATEGEVNEGALAANDFANALSARDRAGLRGAVQVAIPISLSCPSQTHLASLEISIIGAKVQ